MPDYLPAHHEIVLVSGAAEIAGGARRAFRAHARGWRGSGSSRSLVAVFPANVNMALNAERFASIAPVLLWARPAAAGAADLVGAGAPRARASGLSGADSRRTLTQPSCSTLPGVDLAGRTMLRRFPPSRLGTPPPSRPTRLRPVTGR